MRPEPTAPPSAPDPATLAARIAQLGDAVTVLRACERHDLANEVEFHRDDLRRELAELRATPGPEGGESRAIPALDGGASVILGRMG